MELSAETKISMVNHAYFCVSDDLSDFEKSIYGKITMLSWTELPHLRRSSHSDAAAAQRQVPLE